MAPARCRGGPLTRLAGSVIDRSPARRICQRGGGWCERRFQPGGGGAGLQPGKNAWVARAVAGVATGAQVHPRQAATTKPIATRDRSHSASAASTHHRHHRSARRGLSAVAITAAVFAECRGSPEPSWEAAAPFVGGRGAEGGGGGAGGAGAGGGRRSSLAPRSGPRPATGADQVPPKANAGPPRSCRPLGYRR